MKHPLRIAIAQRMLAHGLGAPHGDVDDAGAIQTKDHAALGDRVELYTCMMARRAPFRDS